MTGSVAALAVRPGEIRETAHAVPASPRTVCWGNAGLPSTQRQRAETLLDQQFWCWGQDVRYPGGNLLLDYGFVRQRPPAGQRGSSAYTLAPTPGRHLVLRGFGLSYAADGVGNLFLPRYGFAPRLGDAADAPSTVGALEHLSPLHGPTGRSERARGERCPSARRARRVPVVEVAAAWRDLAALYVERGCAGDQGREVRTADEGGRITR